MGGIFDKANKKKMFDEFMGEISQLNENVKKLNEKVEELIEVIEDEQE